MLVYQKSSGNTKKASAFRIFALQLAPASEYNWPYVPICLGAVPRCIPWWCSKNEICILMTCCHPKGSQAKYCPWQWQAMVDIFFQGLTKCLYFEESPLRGTHPFLRGNLRTAVYRTKAQEGQNATSKFFKISKSYGHFCLWTWARPTFEKIPPKLIIQAVLRVKFV